MNFHFEGMTILQVKKKTALRSYERRLGLPLNQLSQQRLTAEAP